MPVAVADKVYATVCASCHGLDGSRLRQIPPLGDSARQRPYEVLHVAMNGHPGGNMPALRTLGEETVAKMLAYLQTLPHPAYPPNAYDVSAAAETWRCRECHGWDYKGNQGQYASGNHATGIKGNLCFGGC